MRNYLKRMLKKHKTEQTQQVGLSPQLMAWGYEALAESLVEACNPERYDIEESEDGWVIMWKTDDGEWEERYTDYFDGEVPPYFTTEEKAQEALKRIVDDALVHLKQVNERNESLF